MKGELIRCIKGFLNFRNALMTMKSSQYTTIIVWGTRTRFTLSLFKSKSAAALTKYLFFKMAKTFFTSFSLLRFYLDFRTLAPKYSLIYPTIFYMQYDSYSALVG